MTPPNPKNPLGPSELDVASTLINEANALLRQHGADPDNDGTGDDLPMLTEVIFDLGEQATTANTPATPQPTAKAAPRPAAPPPRPPQAGTPPPRTAAPTPKPAAATPTPKPVAPTPKPIAPTSPPAPPNPFASSANQRPSAPKPVAPTTPARAPSSAPPPRTPFASTTPRTPAPPASAPQASRTPFAGVAPRPSAPPPIQQPAMPAALTTSQTGLSTRLPTPPQPSWLRSAPTATITPPARAETPPRTQTPPPRPVSPLASRVPPAPTPPAPAPVPSTPTPATPAPSAPGLQIRAVADELKKLDATIASEVETWVREELSALVVLEIAKLNERLRKETVTHLRATLLPKLTKYIDEQIEKLGPHELT